MQPACKVLAIAAGVLVALTYAWPSKTGEWGIKGAVIGLFFGSMVVAGMLREPKRITLALVGYVMVPLVIVWLFVLERQGDLRDPALQIALFIAFLGVQAAFAILSQAETVG